MFTTGNLILLVLVLAVAWCALSPDSLADKIRVKWFKMKSRASKMLDDSVAEAQRAVAKSKENRAKATTRRNEQRDLRNTAKLNLDDVTREILDLERGADEAARQGKSDLVALAETDLTKLRVDQAKFQSQFDSYDAAVKSIDINLDLLNQEISSYETDVADKQARAAKAQSSKEVNSIMSDMKDNGPRAMMRRSEQILREVEGQAMTLQEDADSIRSERARREELKRLATGGNASMTVDERVAVRMAKFAKPSASK